MKQGKCSRSLYAISPVMHSSAEIMVVFKPSSGSITPCTVNSTSNVTGKRIKESWVYEVMKNYMTMQPQPFFSFASSTGSGSRVVFGCEVPAGAMGGASFVGGGDATRGLCGMVGVSL
jgi:hypothetical protein